MPVLTCSGIDELRLLDKRPCSKTPTAESVNIIVPNRPKGPATYHNVASTFIDSMATIS